MLIIEFFGFDLFWTEIRKCVQLYYLTLNLFVYSLLNTLALNLLELSPKTEIFGIDF